jgi:hypothetical protein
MSAPRANDRISSRVVAIRTLAKMEEIVPPWSRPSQCFKPRQDGCIRSPQRRQNSLAVAWRANLVEVRIVYQTAVPPRDSTSAGPRRLVPVWQKSCFRQMAARAACASRTQMVIRQGNARRTAIRTQSPHAGWGQRIQPPVPPLSN